MANHREDLVRLIENGTPKIGIVTYFMSTRNLSHDAATKVLRASGVMVSVPNPSDGISDERRQELQELSLGDDRHRLGV
jgi:hypothetical protein